MYGHVMVLKTAEPEVHKNYKQTTEDVSVITKRQSTQKKRPDEFEMARKRFCAIEGRVWVFVRYAMMEGNATYGNLMFWDVQDQNSFHIE